MKKTLILTVALLVSSLIPSSALAQDPSLPEPDDGGVVCEPGVYLATPEDCLPLGPSAYLTDLARLGMTIPPRPLPAARPDPGLTQLPFFYFHLEDDYVPIYSSPGEKGSGIDQFMPGFVYVSYIDRMDAGGIYYMMQNGGWIPGKGERISLPDLFPGLQFSSTPRNSFGWPFEQIPVFASPGYGSTPTGRQILSYEVVQIYQTQPGDATTDWYMIGPNEWVEGRKVARVVVHTTPPEGSNATRWIEVDLAEQTLMVYDNYQLVYATVVATGLEPFWTRPGLFQIQVKKETETMRNNDPTDFYYLDNVPWTMYFDGARALHGAYWRTRFGYPQSHGCVNLSVGDAHWLFNWAHEGDWVYVHDPSGLTPTDPALYTGGAY
ncbi:MAG: L,D-transpeptidase [Chloroflexota bacterium]